MYHDTSKFAPRITVNEPQMIDPKKNARKTKDFGDPRLGKLLAAARKRAGFSSAAAAALAYGWPEASLRAHERGGRKIGASDAEKYEAAFGLPAGSLQDRHLAGYQLGELTRAQLSRLKDSPIEDNSSSNEQVGLRLKIARKLRGFETVAAAAKEFGFAHPTLAAHEAGTNRVSELMALAYASAYGISSLWLLKGIQPSGLGARVDQRLAVQPSLETISFREVRSLAERETPPDYFEVRKLVEEAIHKQRVSASDADDIPEANPDQFGPSGPNEGAIASTRRWRLPKGFVSNMLSANPSRVVAVAVDVPNEGLKIGDRVFVDTGRRDVGLGGQFAYSYGKGHLIVRTHPMGQHAIPVEQTGVLIGRVVAVFVRMQVHD